MELEVYLAGYLFCTKGRFYCLIHTRIIHFDNLGIAGFSTRFYLACYWLLYPLLGCKDR